MFISNAYAANGLVGGDVGSPYSLLVLPAVAVIVVLLFVAEKKWRQRKARLQDVTDQAGQTDSNRSAAE